MSEDKEHLFVEDGGYLAPLPGEFGTYASTGYPVLKRWYKDDGFLYLQVKIVDFRQPKSQTELFAELTRVFDKVGGALKLSDLHFSVTDGLTIEILA